jgi:hypothetical protein
VKLLLFRPLLLAPALALVSPVAGATELTWEGHYRARGQFFDSLSVASTDSLSEGAGLPAEAAALDVEGAALSFDHRLRLQPNWLLSNHASLHAQIDLLPYLRFGDEPETVIDPVSGDPVPLAFTESVVVPTTDDGGTTTQNIQVRRAWAEVHSAAIGTLAFGRMPVSWGSGMVWNDGDDPLAEYGDTADRLQLTRLVGPVYLMGAFETNAEQFVGEPDDVSTVSASIAYKTETAGIGTYDTIRYWSGGADQRFTAFTGDIWARAEMGPVTAETELAAVLGGGTFPDTEANDVRLSAFGGYLSVGLDNDKAILGIAGGFGTGDGEDSDDILKTFTFDRDFNMALILFEENLPTLQASVMNDDNGGRDYTMVRTGDAIRNVLFLKPTVGYHLFPELKGTLSVFASQAAKLDDNEEAGKGYGLEFDAAVRYDPFPHAWFQARAGYWMPGRYFSEYGDTGDGYGFDRPVTAVELVGVVEF